MNREEALSLLNSQRSHERLRAARYFEGNGTAQDKTELQAALDLEQTHWVEIALRRALATAAAADVIGGVKGATTEFIEPADDEIYDHAMRESTGLLVHELEPIIGRIRLFGKKELQPDSPLAREIDRLAACVKAIDTLSRAAAAPVYAEFDLAGLVSDLGVQVLDALDVEARASVSLEMVGSTPFLVVGDAGLVELAVSNGLRNAIEATLVTAEDGKVRQVLVSWGKTDREYWIRVLDEGIGLPPGVDRAFDIGTSTKKGHLGMGLPLVARAMETLHGHRSLEPREDKGSRLMLAWPRDNGKKKDEASPH